MSIWQNFKETDHSFEKKFFGAILLMALAITFFYFMDKAFDLLPDVKKLFTDNGKYFIAFLILAVVTYLATFVFYGKTLDFFEAETSATKRAVLLSVILWTIIWLSWSIYCAWLTLNFRPQTLSVKITIWLLLLVPSLTAFLISHNLRRQDIKQENDSKIVSSDNSFEPYTIFIDKKYYSGYYSLLCLPVYLIALLVGQFVS